MEPKRRQVSLSWQVTGLVAAVTVPLMLALGAFAVARNRAALTIDAQHLHAALARQVRGEVEHAFAQSRTSLSQVAEVLATDQLTDDDTRFAVATAVLRSWGGAPSVTVYDLEGRRQGALRLEPDAPAGPERLPPELLGARGFSLGAVSVREGTPTMPLLVPARAGAGQAPAFLVYAELELGALCELVRGLGEAPPLRDPGAVYVIDPAQRVVLHGDPTRIGQPVEGLGDALSGSPSFRQGLSVTTDFELGGAPMMGALVTLPSYGWAAVVQEPATHAYATLLSLEVAVAVAVALAVLAAVLAGVLGARRVIRPLASLVDSTALIARRQWSRVTSTVSDRQDEVGELARAFDEMSRQLELGERELLAQARVRAALSRYLAPDVVELVVNEPSRLQLGGERRVVTVLFADIVGFTRLAEALPPEVIVTVLNEYFAIATEIVHRHHGMVDKFIGDCVMAVWGVPTRGDDDAQQALSAARALRRWVEVANQRWRAKYGLEVQLAMGLNTGLAVAGNVGGERRLDFTVMGDAVNVASRLEASAAPGQILVSQSTQLALGARTKLVELGERHLRGRTKATTVFEVPS
ncbi:MAG: HAMP domain-containing protein [Myxococcaceae bacterium]|nr:HAMP domain-containing protein [Myxococcaceae bacterium]